MINRSSILLAAASVVLAAVTALWLANVLWPYVPPSGEGPRPDNYSW